MANTRKFSKKTAIMCPRDLAYQWHTNPFSFERLIPPWEEVDLIDWQRPLVDGSTAHFQVKVGPKTYDWLATHHDVVPGESFSDIQTEGPFDFWNHTHYFHQEPDGKFILEDKVEYRIPAGPIGYLLGARAIATKLKRAFRYRHETAKKDLESLSRNVTIPRKSVLICGASGLIGRQLAAYLCLQGHTVAQLVRRNSRPIRQIPHFSWDPERQEIDKEKLKKFEVIINLCGDNIGDGQWTQTKKERMRRSRIDSTRTLVNAINSLDKQPELLINASAIGVYGDRGIRELDEESPNGSGFLADLCTEWEEEAAKAQNCRVVLLRLGVVLTPMGGMLSKMMVPFMTGMGGKLGSGEQYLSWIAMDDVLEAVEFVINNQSIKGPVNLTAPKPLQNKDFTEIVGKTIKRPTLVPLPEQATRLAFGEMADETMLASTRVIPEKLLLAGYSFRYPTLDRALKHLLGC